MDNILKPDPGALEERICLKILNEQGAEIGTLTNEEFKVKVNTKFSKIAKAYADKQGLQVNGLTFHFDGVALPKNGTRTVEELELQDGDRIQVSLAQQGGK